MATRSKDLHIIDEKIKKDIRDMAHRRNISMKEMVTLLIKAWKKHETTK